jgi:hypothetical protein
MMWDCPKCGETQFGNGTCQNCVVVIDKPTTDQKIPKTSPEYGKRPQPLGNGLAKQKPTEESIQHRKDVILAKKATDELLDDENFDTSLAASRGRLEMSLAIASEIALRKAKAGCVTEGAVEFIQSVASTYRILANTAQAKPAEEMSDAELAAAAGKK